MIGGYFTLLLGVAWWVVSKKQEHGGGLFPCRAQPELVDRGGLDLCLEHRLRARRRPGRLGGQGRRGHGPLRTACLVPLDAGLGLCALLRPVAGLHHAGVPGKTFFHRFPLRAFHRLLDHLRGLEDRRGDLCRRRGFRGPFAGTADQDRRNGHRQLLDRLGGGDRAHGALHGPGRDAGRGLQRRRADDRPDLRLGHADDLRPLDPR